MFFATCQVLLVIAWALLVSSGCRRRAALPAHALELGLSPPRPAESESREASRVVRILIDAEPSLLEPALDSDVWGARIAFDNIYEPLVRAVEGRFEPVLAERYEVEDDGRSILFHLRPGVQFHDGRPLAVGDVQFTFDRVKSRRSRSSWLKAHLANLAHVDWVGKTTVRFVATRPSGYLLQALAQVPILPEHVFGRGDLAYQPANRRPMGTGPFRLAEWQRGRRIVLERNAAYFGAAPAVERIEFVIEPDAVLALGRLKRHEVDLSSAVPPMYVPEQLESPAIKAGFRAEETPTGRLVFLLWNARRPELADVRVRRALSLICDRKRMVRELRHGLGRPILTPGPLATEPSAIDADPARAEALLDEAGLTRAPAGEPRRGRGLRPLRVQVLYPAGSREATEGVKQLGEAAARAGVTVEGVAVELSLLLARIHRGAFDAAFLEWKGEPGGDEDFGLLLDPKQGMITVENADVQAALEALRHARNAEARRPLYGRLERALAAAEPAAFLYAPTEMRLVSARLLTPRRFGDFLLLRSITFAR